MAGQVFLYGGHDSPVGRPLAETQPFHSTAPRRVACAKQTLADSNATDGYLASVTKRVPTHKAKRPGSKTSPAAVNLWLYV